MIIVETADPAAPGPRALLEASHALMESLFPPEDNHYLLIDDLKKPNIHFFAARAGSETLGTGALAAKDGYGEIKSMFTAKSARGQGVAAALIRQIEDTARELGLPTLKLETGNRLHAAHRLYERQGFTLCGPFGAYIANESSLFMEKSLCD